MPLPKKTLSVSQTAALCGVGRTTVGYWIRSRKLRVTRVGRNYSIPAQDLIFFLKSTGQKIPPELQGDNLVGPIFRSFRHCWEYWQETTHGEACGQCVVFKNRLDVCFTARNSRSSPCPRDCDMCLYYLDIFLPRVHFVNQIDIPAAVVKDLYFWCANRLFAELCEVSKKDFVGMGIEAVVHASSLESVISGAKRRSLGDAEVSERCNLNIKNSREAKLGVSIAVYPLKEPGGTSLILVKSIGHA